MDRLIDTNRLDFDLCRHCLRMVVPCPTSQTAWRRFLVRPLKVADGPDVCTNPNGSHEPIGTFPKGGTA